MPPFHDPHTLHRIQQHLGSAMIGSLLPSLERRVLEEQTDPVVAHVCADINCELEENTIKEVGSDTPATDRPPLWLWSNSPVAPFQTYDQTSKCCSCFRVGPKQPR